MKLFMPPLINNKEIIEQRERQKISNLSKDEKRKNETIAYGNAISTLDISTNQRTFPFHRFVVAALRTAQTVKP